MKKLSSIVLAAMVYGCGATAPVTANMNEMFWFHKDSGVVKEFTDENGTYESVLSTSCDAQVYQTFDNCLGLVFNGDYWIIDGARADNNILVGSEHVMISLNGEIQQVDYVRADTAIVIWRKDNPNFNPIGKILSVNTVNGKGEFTL